MSNEKEKNYYVKKKRMLLRQFAAALKEKEEKCWVCERKFELRKYLKLMF